MLDLQYVDRLLLPGHWHAQSASEGKASFSERLWAFIEKAVHGIALGNAAGDPYFAGRELMLYPLTWDSDPGAPMAAPGASGNPHPHSIQSLVSRGRSVLVHRAGAVALNGHAQALKIGIFASWEDRVRRVMSAEGITKHAEAEKIIRKREEAQASYFQSVHAAHPEDRGLYDICVNTSLEQINLAALKIARAVRTMAPATV
jgi:hypothetical protein